jgi:hypothetical protein
MRTLFIIPLAISLLNQPSQANDQNVQRLIQESNCLHPSFSTFRFLVSRTLDCVFCWLVRHLAQAFQVSFYLLRN